MKKNAMLKIAAILMVAVLLTTCAISSTFAKYTTSDESSDTARVAKWGVEVSCDITGLFETGYNTANEDAATYVVQSAAYDDPDSDDPADTIMFDMLAPGTAGSVTLGAFVTGTPEVAVDVALNATVTLSNFGNYCPIVFTINGNKYGCEGMYYMKDGVSTKLTAGTGVNVYADASALATGVAAAINGMAEATTYAPNTVLDDTLADLDIAWEWVYSTPENVNDVYDVALGDAANATVKISVAPVITQAD